MKIKSNKNIFFGRSPTRFDLAPTYLHQEWNGESELRSSLFENCLFENLILFNFGNFLCFYIY